MIYLSSCRPQTGIIIRQQHRTGCISGFTYLTVCNADIGLVYEQRLFRRAQFIPVPVTDRRIQFVGNIVDDNLSVILELHARRCIVGILVGHHIQQLHRTMRCSCNGQRYVHRLAVGIWCSCISGNKLVIDVNLSLNIPIMSRHCIRFLILTTDVIAVVNNGLCAMHKVP